MNWLTSVRKLISPFVPDFVKRLAQLPADMAKVRQFREWEHKGYGYPVAPPHLIKQNVIKELQSRYHFNTFIETGTYLGDMVYAVKDDFKTIISIELSKELYHAAIERFSGFGHINLIHGDSAVELIKVLDNIHHSILFWLDGHYCSAISAKGDKLCPIFEELDAILVKVKRPHIILIDDARLFVGKNDYPTIDELKSYMLSKNSAYLFSVENDIIKFSLI